MILNSLPSTYKFMISASRCQVHLRCLSSHVLPQSLSLYFSHCQISFEHFYGQLKGEALKRTVKGQIFILIESFYQEYWHFPSSLLKLGISSTHKATPITHNLYGNSVKLLVQCCCNRKIVHLLCACVCVHSPQDATTVKLDFIFLEHDECLTSAQLSDDRIFDVCTLSFPLLLIATPLWEKHHSDVELISTNSQYQTARKKHKKCWRLTKTQCVTDTYVQVYIPERHTYEKSGCAYFLYDH